MHRNRTWMATALVTAALATTGCQPKLYRAETVLHDDGSVQRAIYQPFESTLEDARNAGVWSGSTYAERIEPNRWPETIADLPAAAHDEDHPYFAAWGDFESPAQLPQAFVKRGLPPVADGKLVVAYQREDYVLVIEHHWQETLTDIVTIEDMHLARRQIADLLIPLAQKVLDRVLGDEYDTSKLVDWMHHTATPWFFEVTDVVVTLGGRRAFADDELARALAPACARRGLVLTEASGQLFEGEKAKRAIEQFATRVLRDNLRRRDGEPVSEETIGEILEWLELKDRPENSEDRFKRYEEAAEAVIAEEFGGWDAFHDALSPLTMRVFGLYAGDFFARRHHFRYTLTVPGAIVRTNGTLLSDRTVRWDFGGDEAYPFGYPMECESLAVQAALEKELLGRRVLVDNEIMFKYVDLVRSNAALGEVMRACAGEKSMAPYYQARDAAAASTTEDALEALGKLLELPKDAPVR